MDGSFSSCTPSCPATAAQLQYTSGSTTYGSVLPTGWMNTSTYAYLVSPGAISGGTITLPNAAAPGNASPTGTISMYNFPTISPDGNNFIIQDANYNLVTGNTTNSGGVSQTVTGLVIGQMYQVGFYEAAAQQTGYTGSTTDQWNVTFGGSTQASTLLSIGQAGFSGWIPVTLNFVATATSQLLSFAGTGTGAPPFLALDGVTVKVPEPATWALLGFGFAGLIYARRRRQHTLG